MGKNTKSPAVCQACSNNIVGKVLRFTGVPESAFCSWECQLTKTVITAQEIELEPITTPRPLQPRYEGPTATTLHRDRWCECDIDYENQITVPKRHSLICFCPKCGCVTQD